MRPLSSPAKPAKMSRGSYEVVWDLTEGDSTMERPSEEAHRRLQLLLHSQRQHRLQHRPRLRRDRERAIRDRAIVRGELRDRAQLRVV